MRYPRARVRGCAPGKRTPFRRRQRRLVCACAYERRGSRRTAARVGTGAFACTAPAICTKTPAQTLRLRLQVRGCGSKLAAAAPSWRLRLQAPQRPGPGLQSEGESERADSRERWWDCQRGRERARDSRERGGGPRPIRVWIYLDSMPHPPWRVAYVIVTPQQFAAPAAIASLCGVAAAQSAPRPWPFE